MSKTKKIIIAIVAVAVAAIAVLSCFIIFNGPDSEELSMITALEKKYGAEGAFTVRSYDHGKKQSNNPGKFYAQYKNDGVKVDFKASYENENDEELVEDNFVDMYLKTVLADDVSAYEASLTDRLKPASDKVSGVKYNNFTHYKRSAAGAEEKFPAKDDIEGNLTNIGVLLDVQVPEFKDNGEAEAFVKSMKEDIVAVWKLAEIEFEEEFENAYDDFEHTPYSATRIFIGKNPQIEVMFSRYESQTITEVAKGEDAKLGDTIFCDVRLLDDEGNEKECLNSFDFSALALFSE